MEQTYYRFFDAVRQATDPLQAVKDLAEMLDRQERERLTLAASSVANVAPGGVFTDEQAGIFAFAVQSSRGQGLSVGQLVYVQRDRNIAAADCLAGNPAAGVVVARLQNGYVLWSPLAWLELFVDGDPADVQPTGTNVLWLGQNGFGAFKPPSGVSGAVSQQCGVRYYANSVTHRSYCLVMPGGVRVGL